MSFVAEIEELLKSEDFAKSVDRHALNMLFRNTAILRDPNLSAEQKQQAIENIKAITHNLKPKPISTTPKEVKAPKKAKMKDTKPASTSAPVDVAKPAKQPELAYHPDYEKYYGITEQHWKDADPSAHHELVAYHNKVMSAKPSSKIAKSIDLLYSLFSELRKHL